MSSFRNYINPPDGFWFSVIRKCNRLFPDKLYLQLMFRSKMGYWPNLKNPRHFSEKIQWLKLYNRRPEYSIMVDKYAVKDYVAKIIGEEYIIPTIGVWDKPKDIDWKKLPNQFVLKTTHGGGSNGVVICRDKATFDENAAIQKLNEDFGNNVYRRYREWPYKNVPKRVIAEKYVEDSNGSGTLSDYKFSCFNGEVTDVMVCIDRQIGEPKFYFFDKQWNLLPLNIRGKNAPKGFTLPKPTCMGQMFELASKLSKGLPYARVDLYAVNNKPYFGEITLFPQSGFDCNLLPETENFYGSQVVLPELM